MKQTVSKDYRDGYILALNSCLREGFIIKKEKELLIQSFDKMYEVVLNPGNASSTSDFESIND